MPIFADDADLIWLELFYGVYPMENKNPRLKRNDVGGLVARVGHMREAKPNLEARPPWG